MTTAATKSDSTATTIAEFVQQVGSFFANLGLPRAAGQMFGQLMVCEPGEMSAGEIATAIGLSPASISSSARLLVQINAVEPRHRVGDRRTYYRLRPDFWFEIARGKLRAWDDIADLGRSIRASGDLGRTESVDEMVAFSEFWDEELPKLAARWEEKKSSMREGS